jgi:hypothetical protein
MMYIYRLDFGNVVMRNGISLEILVFAYVLHRRPFIPP